MAGKKRTRTGELKDASPQPPKSTTTTTDAIPPNAQPALPISSKQQKQQPPTNPTPKPHKPQQKLPKLPPNTKPTPRPLLHAALASPYSASSRPKTLYITASTPFIPSIKRIRALLAEATRREKQAADAAPRRGRASGTSAEANGRLAAREVEREIVRGMVAGKTKANVGRECERERVYLKATGRAIPRALEIAVYFQGEEGVGVRVEMGSVRAVDDIEVVGRDEGEEENDAHVPETRMRNVSSVTVSIGFE